MRTDPRPLNLEEARIRASLLLKGLRGDDVERASQAAERLRVLPPFSRLSVAELLGQKEAVQLKHALAAIAHELGHASWAELKRALEMRSAGFDTEAFFSRGQGAALNRWFVSHEEARASLMAEGGFLFPYRHQFFICEAGFLEMRGLDPADPDWARMGFDWVQPLDPDARARLEQKLISLALER